MTDPRLQGMDVRFNGRTLRVTVLCEHPPATANPKAFDAFALRLQTAARGPSLRMAVVAGSMTGKSISLEVVVNTDETSEVLEQRLSIAIEREKVSPAALIVIEEMEPVSATMFWTKLRGVAVDQVAKEKRRS